MLLALLLPDPCDPLCPAGFTAKARDILSQFRGNTGPSDTDLRRSLLRFIADFANWDFATNPSYLDGSRSLVRAAYGEEQPVVVDPFAGGGSIPLEALRLGCDAFGSDVNPVACLILKMMLEHIPRNGLALAGDLRRIGAEIKSRAEHELAGYYPVDSNGSVPIAYLWARTVRCEAPKCGAEMPLIRSFWLSRKRARECALRYTISRSGGQAQIMFEVFKPVVANEVPGATVARAKATCIACGAVLPANRVRAQLALQRGGADVIFGPDGKRTGGARLLAVVSARPGEQGRHYRLPTDKDYEPIRKAQKEVESILENAVNGNGPSPIPNEVISFDEIRRISVPIYGMVNWGDLFTARQKVALTTLVRLAATATAREGAAVQAAIALAIDRTADQMSSLVRWLQTIEAIASTFGRQALGMVWDFCETVPMGDQSANFGAALEWVARVIESSAQYCAGQSEMADAADHPLPDQTASIWFTDPPYYDAVPYAHLSDFFYIWLRRLLGSSDSAMFGSALTPKNMEIVVDRPHALSRSNKDIVWYQDRMASAFSEGRRILREDGIGAVVFAHKTTEGWESLLSGIIDGGWTITGSWPIATERSARVNALDTASLATSVHLVCRPRAKNAGVGEWSAVLRQLPHRVGDWIERLQAEGIRGADLVFACIGPALEIFSRYATVETAEGREVTLGEYLEKVWEVVGRSALEHVLGTAEARARNGAAGALEEDARLTALFLWTVQGTNGELEASNVDSEDDTETDGDEDESAPASGRKGFTLVYDVVRRFAQPLGINLEKWDGRIIDTRKGVVRLVPVSERAPQLFGADGAQAVAARLEQQMQTGSNPLQGVLFPDMEAAPRMHRGRGVAARDGWLSDESLVTAHEATTLDRVHAAMLLQAGGRTNALRALLKSEQERNTDFFRLANALTALYPNGSEEKRLLDAMLLAAPR